MHGLKTIIQMNKGKATLLIDETIRNGGVSFNSKLERLVLNFGYTVSVYSILKTENVSKVEKTLNTDLKNYSNSFYGLWFSNGIFFLDGNINVSSKRLAMELGKLTNQDAIWDERNQEEITL